MLSRYYSSYTPHPLDDQNGWKNVNLVFFFFMYLIYSWKSVEKYLELEVEETNNYRQGQPVFSNYCWKGSVS